MKLSIFIFSLFLFYAFTASAQTYSGKVSDSASGKGIPDIYILLNNKIVMAVTDSTGRFYFSLTKDSGIKDSVSFYHIAYSRSTVSLQALRNTHNFQVFLSNHSLKLNEVTFIAGELNEKVLYGQPLRDKRFDHFNYCNGTKSSAIAINYTLDKVPFILEKIETIVEDKEDHYDELKVYVCGADSNGLPDTLDSYFKKTIILKGGMKKVKIDVKDTAILIFNKNIFLVFNSMSFS